MPLTTAGLGRPLGHLSYKGRAGGTTAVNSSQQIPPTLPKGWLLQAAQAQVQTHRFCICSACGLTRLPKSHGQASLHVTIALRYTWGTLYHNHTSNVGLQCIQLSIWGRLVGCLPCTHGYLGRIGDEVVVTMWHIIVGLIIARLYAG